MFLAIQACGLFERAYIPRALLVGLSLENAAGTHFTHFTKYAFDTMYTFDTWHGAVKF